VAINKAILMPDLRGLSVRMLFERVRNWNATRAHGEDGSSSNRLSRSGIAQRTNRLC